MRIRRAQAWLLAAAAIVSCGKSGGGTTPGGDAGLHGPTDIVASWTLAGKPADAAGCMAHGAAQISVVMNATLDPTLHQSTTVDCATGKVTFSQLLVEKLGNPYLEGTLLDAKGKTVAIAGLDVAPVLGVTSVTLEFFAPQGTGGMGGMTTTSHASSSSSGGTGGAPTTSSSSGGTGGAPTTSSSSSSASSSTSASSSGIVDAGGGG